MVQRPRDLVKTHFTLNPADLSKNYGKLAQELGVSYDTVRRAATEIKQEKLSKTFETTNTSVSTTTTNLDDYVPVEDLDASSLKSYCKSYGIPFELVTSAKFINHNLQEVWNVVCDTSLLTPMYLDRYFDKLKTSLSSIIEPVHFETTKTSNSAAYHFYHSDKHVAAMTKSNSVYSNEYNAKIFEKRLLQTLDDYRFEAEQRSGRFDKVLVTDLGDSVDGWNKGTTRSGKGSSHVLPQNLDNTETFDVYVFAMCKFFDNLVELDLANEYEFIAVTNDNHGGSFSYIVNRAVEIYLNLRYPQIKTKVSKEFIINYTYGKHAFLFTHGKDELEMKFGWPINLDEKVLGWLNQYIRKKQINQEFIHVVKGDLHQENQNVNEALRYRNCLSMYGPSAWSMMNHGFGQAGSSYEIVYKDCSKVLPGYMLFEMQ